MKLYLEVYKCDFVYDSKKPFRPVFLSFCLNPHGNIVRTKPCETEPVGFRKQLVKFDFSPESCSNVKICLFQSNSNDKPTLLAHLVLSIPTMPLNRRTNSKFTAIPEKIMKEPPKIFIKIQLSDDDTPPFKAMKGDFVGSTQKMISLTESSYYEGSASSDDIHSQNCPFFSLMAHHMTSGRALHRSNFYQQKQMNCKNRFPNSNSIHQKEEFMYHVEFDGPNDFCSSRRYMEEKISSEIEPLLRV